MLNFSLQDEANIWSIVATVMHLGNIMFGGEYRQVMEATYVSDGT